MVKDLIVLALIGCILEGLVTKFSSLALASAITMSFSFFVVVVAVIRWNCYGLILIPLLVGATILGGKYTDAWYLREAYGWQTYVATCCGLLSIGLNVILFKTVGTRKVVNNVWLLILMICVDYLIVSVIQVIVYRLCCGSITGNEILYTYHYFDKELDDTVFKTINLCKYVESGFIFNLFGLAIAIIGVMILRSQGAIGNVVQKLVDDKKEAELIKNNTEGFCISEVADESDSMEKESDKNEQF